MPQDAFHIRRIAEELDATVSEGKVNKITQADKDEVTFFIYTKNGVLKLVFNTNASFARVCIQKSEREPLLVSPSFCMLLRKHLSGAKLLSVKQVGNERILALTFFCLSDFSHGEKILYAELMGKYSNLVLTENGVVLGALKTTSLENASGRVLFSGAKYALPLPQDKVSPSDSSAIEEKWNAFLNGATSPLLSLRNGRNSPDEEQRIAVYGEATAKFLFENVAGIAASTARNVLSFALRRSIPVHAFPSFFTEFYLTEPCRPCVVSEKGKYVDFFAFEAENSTPCVTLNAAEELYFISRGENKFFNEKKAKLCGVTNAKIKKCERNLADTLRRLQEADHAEENKIEGELITANLYKISRGDAFLYTENWYDNGKEIKIALDPLLSPSENAQRFFKIYAKEKRTKEVLTPRKQKEEEELTYFRSVLAAVDRASDLSDLTEIEEELRETRLLPPQKTKTKRKEEISVPFRKYVFSSFTVLVGRNNLSNDRLTKSLDAKDVWLHAQKYHSAHVGILSEGKDVPQEVILAAAQLCAHFSSVKGGDKIPVDYTLKKYVKKPKKAPLGFVTYTDYKTIYTAADAHEEAKVL